MRCSTISTIINLIGQVLFLCVHISGIFTTLEEASYYRHQPFSHFKTIKLIMVDMVKHRILDSPFTAEVEHHTDIGVKSATLNRGVFVFLRSIAKTVSVRKYSSLQVFMRSSTWKTMMIWMSLMGLLKTH